MEVKKLAIIIPVYNMELYLEKCLDSILMQNSDEYEIIIVDDGSIDKSKEILNEYQNKAKNIKLIFNNHGGVSKARNTGILASNAKYLMFLDSDDSLNDNVLVSLLALIEQSNSSLLVSSHKIIENGVESIEKYQNKILNCQDNLKNIAEYIKFVPAINWYPWGKIFRTDIIKNNNILFDETLKCSEDMLFFYTYLTYCQSIQISDLITVNYLIRSNSASNKLSLIKLENDYFVYLSLLNKYSKYINNLERNEVLTFLENFFYSKTKLMALFSKKDRNILIKKVKENKKYEKYLTEFKLRLQKLFVSILGWNITLMCFSFYYKLFKKS